MDYYERSEAVVNIGRALARLGWKLYGYHEDRSDSQTDYFCPASWDGIATKKGYTACVDTPQWFFKNHSGKDEVRFVMIHGDLPDEPQREVLFTWPAFQANPKHRTWHVEKDGVVLISGIGLKKAATQWNDEDEAAGARALAKKIDRITNQGKEDQDSGRQNVGTLDRVAGG